MFIFKKMLKQTKTKRFRSLQDKRHAKYEEPEVHKKSEQTPEVWIISTPRIQNITFSCKEEVNNN